MNDPVGRFFAPDEVIMPLKCPVGKIDLVFPSAEAVRFLQLQTQNV
jgi:hypothetical protein